MYISRRFIDYFRPGQVIPNDAYDASTFAKLLEKGHIVEADENGEAPPVPLEEMTDQELKDLAKEQEVKGYWSMKRDTLLEKLRGN